MNKPDSARFLSPSLLYDLCRIVLAVILLALTAIVHLSVAVKAVFAILAIVVLILHRRNSEGFTNLEIGMICFAVSIGTLAVCSKSSFLYPFNDWVDANCFFTVGKSMMNGIVVYRDLLEQKGPFLYFVHGLAWLISNDTFIGVYFMEVLAATFSLYYTYRAISLFVQTDWSVLVIPICAAMIYTCYAFSDGDSVEELALPFLAYALWVGLDAICSKRDITKREYFIIGLTSGLIFWSKFTVVGLYVGWYLYFAVDYIRSGKWKMLFQSILLIVCGVAASTIPFIIYFGIHGAIGDWLTVYLYNNLFLYSSGEHPDSILQIAKNILGCTYLAVLANPLMPIMCMIAVVYFAFHKLTVALYLVSSALFMIGFAFVGGIYHDYYPFIINLFLPLGTIPFLKFIASRKGAKRSFALNNSILLVIIAGCIAVSAMLTPNRYLMGVKKEELPQYKFASIIGDDDSATLLNYGFLDGGFHTVTNTLPTCKVFCLLSITSDVLLDTQNGYIENAVVDYIVTRGVELSSSNYHCISSCDYFWEGNNVTCYLYQRK